MIVARAMRVDYLRRKQIWAAAEGRQRLRVPADVPIVQHGSTLCIACPHEPLASAAVHSRRHQCVLLQAGSVPRRSAESHQ